MEIYGHSDLLAMVMGGYIAGSCGRGVLLVYYVEDMPPLYI